MSHIPNIAEKMGQDLDLDDDDLPDIETFIAQHVKSTWSKSAIITSTTSTTTASNVALLPKRRGLKELRQPLELSKKSAAEKKPEKNERGSSRNEVILPVVKKALEQQDTRQYLRPLVAAKKSKSRDQIPPSDTIEKTTRRTVSAERPKRTAATSRPVAEHADAGAGELSDGSEFEEEQSTFCASDSDSESSVRSASPPTTQRKAHIPRIWEKPLLRSPTKRSNFSSRRIIEDSDDAASEPEKRPQTPERSSASSVEPVTAVRRPRTPEHFAEPAFLYFSPPRTRSPAKISANERPQTPPPPSPSKSRLTSPSKKFKNIPLAPHRQSIDPFWDQAVINGWNDQHSPRKTLKSPSKPRFLINVDTGDASALDADFPSPSASPRKSPSKIVSAERAAIEARKQFAKTKHDIATKFLAELDEKITHGEIARLSRETGGIQLEWSNKLQSTAGRAHWRKEGKRSSTGEVHYKHSARIELAEKVIDNEERLINVMAHEFCHLANFMISGTRGSPHGREFQAWGRKCSTAFAHRGVVVTTKHRYEIEYKYIWACGVCAMEYKRHSKSIDIKKHCCGSCKNKLVQIKPAPRKVKDGANASEYQMFVKTWFKTIKSENPNWKHGQIMEELGRRYKAQKAAREAEKASLDLKEAQDDVAGLVEGMTAIDLDD